MWSYAVHDENEREARTMRMRRCTETVKTYLNKSLDMHDAIKWITCNAWFMVIYMCIYYTVRSPCAASYTFLFRIIFSFSPNDFDSWIWPFNVRIHPFFFCFCIRPGSRLRMVHVVLRLQCSHNLIDWITVIVGFHDHIPVSRELLLLLLLNSWRLCVCVRTMRPNAPANDTENFTWEK